MPEILVFCPASEGRRIIEEQLHSLGRPLRHAESKDELIGLATALPTDVVVVDLWIDEGRPITPVLHALAETSPPAFKVILSYDPSPEAFDHLATIACTAAPTLFASMPCHRLDRILPPLLRSPDIHPPVPAGHILTRLLPELTTAAARRFITAASLNPLIRQGLPDIARVCEADVETLRRDLAVLGEPTRVKAALAWPYISYLCTGLQWQANEVAEYCGVHDPRSLIDLLGEYVESKLWRWGLDPTVDAVAAAEE